MRRFFCAGFLFFIFQISVFFISDAKAEDPVIEDWSGTGGAGSCDPSEPMDHFVPPPNTDPKCVPASVPPHLAPADTESSLKLIPLPIYATLPNEGSTWGLMPVMIVVDKKTERTKSIYAPSASWNAIIGETGTFRWFHYPDQFRTLTITASASRRENWGGIVAWENENRTDQDWTETLFFRWQRSVFFRFFGIGPDTLAGAESSHTRIRGSLSYRRGWNFTPYFNLAFRMEIGRDLIQPDTAPGLPSSPIVFAGTPGMAGASVISEAIEVRYDTRENRDYSTTGEYVNLAFGPVQGLSGSPDYWMTRFEARKLFHELEWLSGGARIYWKYVSSPEVPFYQQSILGGSFLMRGFQEDRFVDQGAWTLELEQRIRVFQTHIYGVTTDWRVDPFIAIGQVYHPGGNAFSNIKTTQGVGFRAWVRPNVLGRVDAAFGGEGLKFYVELGYPF